MSNGNGSVAPHCPISHSQQPTNPHGHSAMRLPAIPIATDLPSLIRSVNIMRDILRNITTSLTVNNTYLPRAPRQPKVYGDRTYNISPYPDWYQVEIENESGYVGKDPKARAHVERLHKVVFRNNERDDDNLFKWLYKKPLTGRGGGNEPFEEDYFERLVKVKWKKKEAPEYYSVTWFWNIEVRNPQASGVSQGCMPWEEAPAEWDGALLMPPGSACSWGNFKFRKFGDDTRIIVSGQPSGSGDGGSNDHHLAGIGPKQNIIGEHLSGIVLASPLSEAKCWGSGPYPPQGLGGYWSALCRLTKRNVWETIGAISVSAAGITAKRASDGKPLKKTRTEMSMNPSSYGGIIVVSFTDDDD